MDKQAAREMEEGTRVLVIIRGNRRSGEVLAPGNARALGYDCKVRVDGGRGHMLRAASVVGLLLDDEPDDSRQHGA